MSSVTYRLQCKVFNSVYYVWDFTASKQIANKKQTCLRNHATSDYKFRTTFKHKTDAILLQFSEPALT